MPGKETELIAPEPDPVGPPPANDTAPVTFRPVKQAPLYIGLDIGGTKLAAGLVTGQGQVLKTLFQPTLAHEGGPAVLGRSLDLVERLFEEGGTAGLARPVAIGIASAGQIDYRRGVVTSATGLLPGWAGLHLSSAFEERFGLPCRVDNDVNALAQGEVYFGASRNYPDALFVTAGTGLGGAIVSGGRLWHGAHFSAGEVGHSLYIANGYPCECGRQGCLEQYTATSAIRRYFQERQSGNLAAAPGIPEIAALAAQDPAGPAGQAFSLAGQHLGKGLAGLVRIVDPQAIILGGGLVAASPLYLNGVRAAFAAEAWTPQAEIPILVTGLGPNAGIIGAASLCLAA